MTDHFQVHTFRVLLLGASMLIITSCRQQDADNASELARMGHYEVIEVTALVTIIKCNFAIKASRT